MQITSALPRLAALTIVAATVFAVDADAQLGARADHEFLIMNPVPGEGADTAYAVRIGNETRERLFRRLRFKITVFDTDMLNQVLTSSGFERDLPLGPVMVAQMTQILRETDAYASWIIERQNGAPVANLRLVDHNRSGIAGSVTVRGGGSTTPRQFADMVVDSLDAQFDAARDVRGCYDRRDRQQWAGAKSEARKVFEKYPNHPSAANCLATVYEASGAPADSLIPVYRIMTRGNPTDARSWARLGQLYLQVGDTASAVSAFQEQLSHDPNNVQLILGLAAMYNTLGQYDESLSLIEDAVERMPGDLTIVRFWSETCVDAGRWDCAVQALSTRFENDSAIRGEEAFYQQIYGAAQQAEDTTAMLQWSARAVENLPDNVTLWRARAQTLRDAGMYDQAIAAYLRVAELTPDDWRPLFAAGEITLDGFQLDTANIDTATIVRADSLFGSALAIDSAPALNVAVELLNPARQIAQTRKLPWFSINLLQRVLDLTAAAGGNQQLETQANFFLGFSIVFVIPELDNRVIDTESCEAVREERRWLTTGKAALQAGAQLQSGTAQQLMGFYNQYEARLPQLQTAFCGS